MIHSPIQTLFNYIPRIKRARGYRLYDDNGNRIIDLYQNNGHALLGHRAYKVTTVLKNVISKGIIFDLPSVYEYRLKKAVKELIPGINSICIAGSLEHGLKIISAILKTKITENDIYESLYENRPGKIALWRPFLKYNLDSIDTIIPVLPFSVAHSPVLICFKKKYQNLSEYNTPISPLILAGAIRAVYDLKKYVKPEWLKEDILKGSKKWKQKGIYIIPDMNKKEYTSVFKEFLKKGILLSPHFPGPSIFPAELSHGEFRKILRLLNQE